MEEEHEPSLRVEEALPDLINLEVLVLNTSLILAKMVDNNGFLSLVDEFGFDGGVWEEEADDQGPDDRHATGDPEHGTPLVLAS